jgi:hypothetical protein
MMLKSCFVLLLLTLSFTTNVFAQEQPETAAESLDRLRAQLLEVQAREEDLRLRAQQLEESLKPENIERSLAGVGSTRPEELRESRRRQLTIERNGVLAQLKLLESSRQRLETAISNAEALAYQESARPAPTAGSQILAASSRSSYRWLIIGGGGFAALAFVGALVLYRRRMKLR